MNSAGNSAGAGTAPTRRVRRIPVVVVLLAALGVALFAGDAEPALPRAVETPTDPVALPPPGARSVAWYCAGGPLALRATDAGDQLAIGDEEVRIANTTDEAQVVRITVMSEAEIVGSERREVPPAEVLHVPVQELTDAVRPGVVIEAFSDGVAVEHVVRGSGVAAGPCATEPASTWYLPTGRTVDGTMQFLTLFNPFGDDAVVDIVFDTREGRREPESLNGFVVPRRSRRTILVHQEVFREEFNAATITARTGRIIATQTLEVESSGTGTAASLGAVASAPEWSLSGGLAAPGLVRTLVVMNPGDVDVEVDVQVLTDDDSIVEPLSFVVARRSSSDLDVSAVVPDGVGYTLLVQSPSERGIVVGDSTRWDEVEIAGDVISGVSTTLGSNRAANSWVFVTAKEPGTERVDLLVGNGGVNTAVVNVEMVGEGRRVVRDRGVDVEVPGGATVRIRLGTRGLRDAALIVTSSEPVTVERRLINLDGAVSVEPGIPPTPEIIPAGTTTTTVTATTTTTAAPTTTTTNPPSTTTTRPRSGSTTTSSSRPTSVTSSPTNAVGDG